MKNYLALWIVLLCVSNVTVKGQIENKQLYERKVKTYAKMKRNGSTLAIIGSIGIAAGTALILTSPSLKDDYDSYEDDDVAEMHVMGGLLCIEIGVPMLIGGCVLGGVGSRKYKHYKQKLDGLSMKMIISPQQQGLALTYRF